MGYLRWSDRVSCRALIPDVGQLVFPQVPFEGWIIYADEHSLLDSPGVRCMPPCLLKRRSPHPWGVLWSGFPS